MAQRTFWKGYLKLSLVTCPVAMMPATTESAKIRFHTINRATGNRIMSRYVDSVTHKVVDDDEQVKGYETGEGEYVMLEEDEIASVALESTRTIDIEQFVPRDSIEWLWYDKPHYLVRSEEHTSELQSLMRISYAVFCLKKKKLITERRCDHKRQIHR